jgi:PAS domain-containing protein
MESHPAQDSDVLACERRLRLEAEARCEALRESERRYQDLVDQLPAALYTCDADGRVQTFNAAAVALWGRSPVAGQDRWCGSYRIFRPDGSALPLAECPMAVTLREGTPVVGERGDRTARRASRRAPASAADLFGVRRAHRRG